MPQRYKCKNCAGFHRHIFGFVLALFGSVQKRFLVVVKVSGDDNVYIHTHVLRSCAEECGQAHQTLWTKEPYRTMILGQKSPAI